MNGKSKIILFYEKKNYKFFNKFISFFDLLAGNINEGEFECFCLFGIYYLQILSAFFSKHLNILKEEHNSDNILILINKILRLKDYMISNKKNFELIIYLLFVFIIFLTVYMIILFKKNNRKTLYTTPYLFLNYLLKFSSYYLLGLIFEFFSTVLCFGNSTILIKDYECSIKKHLVPFIIILLIFIISVFSAYFLNFFFLDSFFLNNNCYGQIISNYWPFLIINNIQISVCLRFVKEIRVETFLILNLIISIYFFYLFTIKLVFYYDLTNSLAGIFHILYIWTCLFMLIFKFINVKEKGVIYFISSFVISLIFLNLKSKFLIKFLFEVPFYKLQNKNYILYYIKFMIKLISEKNDNIESKKILNGMIKLHISECPNNNCVTKTTEKIYLPMTNNWSDRSKPILDDLIFLDYYILSLFAYYINAGLQSVELFLNLSDFYLEIIGNINLSIYYFHKVKNMKKNISELFLYNRLKIKLSQKLVEKLKKKNEYCSNLQELNPSYLFLYQKYKENFINEIFRDLDLTIDFWNSFIKANNKNGINFNTVFKKTEKIKITKNNISNYWNKIYSIYNGINELFDFYMDYTEIINDDSYLKRELEEIKKKTENFSENFDMNYYNLLFKPETAICLVSGDYGKEGLILETNSAFCEMFLYDKQDLLNKNISILLPKMFAEQHDGYIKNYINKCEKKVINTKSFFSYGKDSENSLILLRMSIKIYPVLNDSLIFIGMVQSEKVDDLIFIDNNFIIQGMSKKLKENLNLESKGLFADNDIPFYMICKNFINFYKTFMNANKKQKSKNEESLINKGEIQFIDESEIEDKEKEKEKENEKENNNDNNIEINENIELEYEIKIPNFLLEFDKIFKNNKKSTYKIDTRELFQNLPIERKTSDLKLNDDSEKNSLIDETSNLISNEENEKKQNYKILVSSPIDKNLDYTPGQTPGNTPDYHKHILNSPLKKLKITTKENFEKIFIQKNKEYKNLFNSNKFNELEKLIDNDTAIDCISYRFNFTFRKYNFKESFAYIIKCIDTKIEKNNFDDSDENENLAKKPIKVGNITSELPKLCEIFQEEFDILNENNTKYYQLLNGDTNFENICNKLKLEIKKYSRILGNIKKEEYEDENLSQSAQTGFKNDLSKINKILEIRENIIKNNKKYWTLKYLFTFASSYIFFSLVFIISFYIIFNTTKSDLGKLDILHSSFYIAIIRMTEMISSMISLKTYEHYIYTNQTIKINLFTNSSEDYFDILINHMKFWNNKAFTLLGEMEGNFSKFINNVTGIFFNQTEAYFLEDFPLVDSESYYFNMMRCIENSKSGINSNIFTLNSSVIFKRANSIDSFVEVQYTLYNVIENSYDVILPMTLNFFNYFRFLVLEFNNGRIIVLLIFSLVYFVVSFSLVIIYSRFLMITNDYMGKGLEKLATISQDKIKEVITNATEFKQGYIYLLQNNKFLNPEYVIKKKRNEEITQTTIKQTNIRNSLVGRDSIVDKKESSIIKENASAFGLGTDFSNFEIKKNKKLSLQNSSYLHLILLMIVSYACILFLFFIFKNIIKSNKEIIEVQAYIFGKIASSVISTIYIKCIIAECEVNSTLDYNSFFDNDLVYILYDSLNHFPEWAYFYKQNFLLNACASMYKEGSEEYISCFNNKLVRSINNTEGFLNFLSEIVTNLKFEYTQNNLIHSDFHPDYLTESENYKLMETVLYNFIEPSINNINEVLRISYLNMLKKKKQETTIVFVVFIIALFIFFVYVYFIFIPKFEYLLDVSNSILKIIPTNIISSSQDMENWLDQLNSSKN